MNLPEGRIRKGRARKSTGIVSPIMAAEIGEYPCSPLRGGPVEQHQLPGVLDRKRPQHNRVDQAEDGSVSANAQSQREYGHQREAGIL